jgi:hypothetical protein
MAAMAVAVLVAGGVLVASNMGFKLNYVLAGTASSNSGTNTMALPYNQMVGLGDAKNLIDDINATGTPTGQVLNIQRWDPTSDSLTVYGGLPTDPAAFSLTAGEAYFVKMGATNTNYIVVGSHDPAKVINLQGPPASGTNFFGIPYHTTSANAKDLIDDVNLNGSPTGQVLNVQKWDKAADSLIVYGGLPTDPAAFTFVPGEGVFVKVNSAVTWTPSHF